MADGEDTADEAPPGRPPRPSERQGFLPIVTNAFDRWFISVVVLIALHLFWMRFLEVHLSLWFATGISVALGVLIVRKG